MTSSTLKNLEAFVIELLRNDLPEYLYYHTANHTIRVLENVKIIAKYEKITSKQLELLKIAALFHDTGFLISMNNHEDKSCKIAQNVLTDFGLPKDDIQIICSMIMATKIPQNPVTKLEEILADADLEYLGTDDFNSFSTNLYLELKHINPALTLEKWNQIQIDFFENHSYFTDYAKTYLTPKKMENLELIKRK